MHIILSCGLKSKNVLCEIAHSGQSPQKIAWHFYNISYFVKMINILYILWGLQYLSKVC